MVVAASFVSLAISTNVSSRTPGVLCGGNAIVAPSSNWVWSSGAAPSPSCTSPPVENNAQMCSGDPTSVVIQGNGQPQCLGASMPDCRFNLRNIQQLDFDVNMIGCGGTWAAPLWMSPEYWAGGGASGEIDMMENCPSDAVWNNFAGGGTQVRVTIADPNSFQGHTTMWNQADEGTDTISTHVTTCDPSDVQGGSCPETGAVAYYQNIFGANGCNGHNCMYTLISDIWNGLAGDDGYQSCAGGQTHYSSGCHVSVSNIRFKASPGTFSGKCSELVSSSSSPVCGDYPACAGLTGDCCPTTAGVTLACCNQLGVNESLFV